MHEERYGLPPEIDDDHISNDSDHLDLRSRSLSGVSCESQHAHTPIPNANAEALARSTTTPRDDFLASASTRAHTERVNMDSDDGDSSIAGDNDVHLQLPRNMHGAQEDSETEGVSAATSEVNGVGAPEEAERVSMAEEPSLLPKKRKGKGKKPGRKAKRTKTGDPLPRLPTPALSADSHGMSQARPASQQSDSIPPPDPLPLHSPAVRTTPLLSTALYIPPEIIYNDHGIPKWLRVQLDLALKLKLFQGEWSQLLARLIALERKFGFHEKLVSCSI